MRLIIEETSGAPMGSIFRVETWEARNAEQVLARLRQQLEAASSIWFELKQIKIRKPR